MRNGRLTLAGSLLLACLLAGCSGDRVDFDAPVERVLEFREGDQGVSTGFADYPEGEEDFYELDAGWEPVPGLDGVNGLYLSGNNHSDDLFMYFARPLTGLAPRRRYLVRIHLDYATNVGADCVGVGGSPGGSVYVKAGLSPIEPVAKIDGEGMRRMNIDKGSQSSGGSDAMVLGDMAGGRPGCEDNPYEIKSADSAGQSFTTMSDGDGSLWLLAGTDSGFEGTTRIYFTRMTVRLDPRD